MTTLLTATALFFSTACEKYLVAHDPTALETESDSDLEQYRLTTKARIYLYGHPADHVLLRLIEHEIVTRQMAPPVTYP